MYLLKTLENNPFAIIKNDWKSRVVQAIEEEYSLSAVTLNDEFRFPDYCENIEITFIGLDDDLEQHEETIEITKLVDY